MFYKTKHLFLTVNKPCYIIRYLKTNGLEVEIVRIWITLLAKNLNFNVHCEISPSVIRCCQTIVFCFCMIVFYFLWFIWYIHMVSNADGKTPTKNTIFCWNCFLQLTFGCRPLLAYKLVLLVFAQPCCQNVWSPSEICNVSAKLFFRHQAYDWNYLEYLKKYILLSCE